MPQLKYPNATLDGDASWSKDGGPSTIHECLAQPIATANDAQKIASGIGDSFRVALDAPLDPNESYDEIELRFRAGMTGPDVCSIIVDLYEGEELRDTRDMGSMPLTLTDFVITYDFVTSGITDYTAISVVFAPTKSTSDDCVIVAVELSVPDRRAHVHVST